MPQQVDAPRGAASSARPRRTLSGLLVILGTLLAVLSIMAVWVGRQALETEQWTQTSSQLLEDPAVQTALAGYLVDQLYASVPVEEELRTVLPERFQPLAGPAAGALRSSAEDVAERALERPEVQQAWQDANRQAHILFVDVVEGDGNIAAVERGVVTLDVKALLDEVVARTGIGSRVAQRVPADAATIEVFRSEQLSTIQVVGRVLKPLALVLVLAMLACYGGAIALVPGRRRAVLRATGTGLVFAGVAALGLRSALGDVVVDELASTAAVEPAAEATWTIGTSLLVGVATATIAYGAVVIVGAWLAGPTRISMALRRSAAPYLRDSRIAYAAFTAIVALVLLWAPTEGTRRVLPAIVLVALALVGFEALRRVTAREFPEARRGEHRVSVAGMRAAAQRWWSATITPAPPASAPAAPPPPAMPLPPAPTAPAAANGDPVAQLERLIALHRSGGLDDEEFATAKERVLAKA
jgi:hypothetical protein